MAKELTCEILKEYGEINIDENFSIKIAEVKWGGRQPKGFDIRKYSKEDDRLGKGITIPYDSVEDLVKIIISNDMCKIDKIEKFIKERKDQYFTNSDFMNMFNNLSEQSIKYTRDKYGKLRDKDNRIVISSRKKRKG
jgi:hypothetical protein